MSTCVPPADIARMKAKHNSSLRSLAKKTRDIDYTSFAGQAFQQSDLCVLRHLQAIALFNEPEFLAQELAE